MSVKSLVQDIARKAPAWGVAEILRKINDAQNFIYTRPCRQTLYVDPTTGMPPTLATTGAYEYTIPDIVKSVDGVDRTLRIAKVIRVFVDASVLSEYSLPYLGDEFELSPTNPYSGDITRKRFRVIPVDSYEATESDRARVMFKSNPGTTTGVYYYECVIEPLQLTSVNMPLMLPQKWERAIFDGVVGQIQDNAYGKDSRMDKFYEYWCPQIWHSLDQGAQSNPVNTPVFY
jgi:hypothetical protein